MVWLICARTVIFAAEMSPANTADVAVVKGRILEGHLFLSGSGHNKKPRTRGAHCQISGCPFQPAKLSQRLSEDRLGVILSVNSVGRLLHRQGLTPQKPLRRAYERDEAAVTQWKENEYPKIQKEAKKQGAEIFWLDEAAIRSDDPLQRTWGLKGETPIVQTSGQRQSVNAISALSNKVCLVPDIHGKFNGE